MSFHKTTAIGASPGAENNDALTHPCFLPLAFPKPCSPSLVSRAANSILVLSSDPFPEHFSMLTRNIKVTPPSIYVGRGFVIR